MGAVRQLMNELRALCYFLVRWLSSGDDGDGGAAYHDGRAVGGVHLPASVVSSSSISSSNRYRHAATDEILPTNIVRRAWISSNMRQ